MNTNIMRLTVAICESLIGYRTSLATNETAARQTKRLSKPANVKRCILWLAVIAMLPCIMISRGSADDLGNTVLMQAMNDELNRTMADLRIVNQDRPYYVAYRATDELVTEIQAGFGGLISSASNKNRHLWVDLRVGSQAMDNSNFLSEAGGPSAIESDQTGLPLDDDYYALRQSIWLVTDGTYKKALERLSRKKAVIQNRQAKDSLPDFSPVNPCVEIEPEPSAVPDRPQWESRIKEISKIFQQYPDIDESSVTMRVDRGSRYFLDSEGGRSRAAIGRVAIEVLAKTRSIDGDPLEDFIGFYAQTVDGLPAWDRIHQAVAAMAETLSLASRLKKEEGYSGPVLFLGQAAAELMFQALAKGVSDPRAPLKENDMVSRNANPDNLGALSDRMGRKVLPEFMSAYDDPGLKRWGEVNLVGGFTIDDQGVRAQRVDLVKDGKLTGLLMSRSPIKKIGVTNGHARFRNETYGGRACGMPGVMVVESRVNQTSDELMAELIATAKEYGNQYALIVSRLTPTRPKSTPEQYLRWFMPPAGAGDKPVLSAPSVCYRVDVETGKAELVRGLDFSGVTTRVLRDISAVSRDPYVYNFTYHDSDGNDLPTSVIAPAVLIDEMDLVTKETKPIKAPVLSHPFFKKR